MLDYSRSIDKAIHLARIDITWRARLRTVFTPLRSLLDKALAIEDELPDLTRKYLQEMRYEIDDFVTPHSMRELKPKAPANIEHAVAGSTLSKKAKSPKMKETESETSEDALKEQSQDGKIGENNTDELFSKRPTSFDPMDEARFSKIQEAFKRQGKVIDNSDDALRYLETREAAGVTFNAETILLRPDASPSTVFEELIHATQHRTGRYQKWTDQYGNAGAVAKAEHEAAKRLVKHQHAYGISDGEHALNIERVKRFGSELHNLGVPLD